MAENVPLHLAGNNAPVAEEVTLEPAKVVGEIPAELSGQFFRNGPNPRTGWSPHSFASDGMIHTVALDGGRARWYRNRYVRTPLYENPGVSRFALAFDPETSRIDYRVTTANTHLIAHAGRLFALEEGGFPYEVTPDLATIGAYTFDGALRTPMTAHPKTCPITGELLFFGYRLRPPYLTYYRADAAGKVAQTRAIDMPRATMMHDFAVTRDHVIFLDLPVVFDAAQAAAGGPPWRWDDGHRARFGVLPRTAGDDAPVRWYDIAPCYVWHTMNAFEDPATGIITVTGTRVPSLWRGGPEDVGGGLPTLYRWTLDPRTGTVAEAPIDDAPSEFPRVADNAIGLPHRYGYTASFALEAEPERSEIYAYDLADGGVRAVHRFPAGHTCGEAVFVARDGTAENDGYLMTFVHDRATDRSYLAILNAADPAAPPLAEVHVPVRVPAGFHGNWIPA
ncbi:dioxygenase [Spongiactinospora gelatinilytica]|uniref:Dioxygenase n=1 Tax=Spongiactinospora gelatinilytica TaxID=2666298 RepID=A0A2W2GJI9_9ACTN|nr:carotenoid oxygenase family protein [Spongiactinospora gelatinilytica]PZG34457.1 dioxygenase [Spongiactinospora gelatinilytica]